MPLKGQPTLRGNRGKHIITTAIEHPSVEDACQSLTRMGYEIAYLPVNEFGQIDITDLKDALREDTILVSVMHVNNEVGSIQPIAEVGKLLKQYPNVLFHVDNVQGAGKVSLSLREANVDLCTISGTRFTV